MDEDFKFLEHLNLITKNLLKDKPRRKDKVNADHNKNLQKKGRRRNNRRKKNMNRTKKRV
ncbi:hypothetical protein H5410_047464, partial [Solanum commersonii]